MEYQIFRADRKTRDIYVLVYKKTKSFFHNESYYAKYFHNNQLHTIIDIYPEDVTMFCKMYEILFNIADRQPWHFNKDNMLDRLHPFMISDLYKSMWNNFCIIDEIDFIDDGTDFSLKTGTFHLQSEGDRCFLHLHMSKYTTECEYQDFYKDHITREQGELFISVLGIFVEQMGLIGWGGIPHHTGEMYALDPCSWKPINNQYYLGNTQTFIEYYKNSMEYTINLDYK